MTDEPRLAVVVVSYRCRDHLVALLGDLAAACNELPLQVTVVDNASGDGTVDLVRRDHPWVELVAHTTNVGFGRANNIGLQTSVAPIVALLNPDTRVDGAALRACVDELERHPDVGILTPRVVDADGRFDRRCMRGFPTLWATVCHVTRLDRVLRDRRSRRYTMGWLNPDVPADVEAVSGAVMFARADVLRHVGGFDERYFMYGEDIDLCLRVAAAGWRVRYWPGAEVTHLGGGSGWSPESRRAWAQAIGQLQRTYGTGRAARLAAILTRIGGEILRRTTRGGSS